MQVNNLSQREKSPDITDTQSAVINTHDNASVFAVYALVRQAVLAQAIRDSTRMYHQANTNTDSDTDSDEENEEKGMDLQIKIPKVIFICLFVCMYCIHCGSQYLDI